MVVVEGALGVVVTVVVGEVSSDIVALALVVETVVVVVVVVVVGLGVVVLALNEILVLVAEVVLKIVDGLSEEIVVGAVDEGI